MSIFFKLVSLIVVTVIGLVSSLLVIGYLLVAENAENTVSNSLADDKKILQAEIENNLDLLSVLSKLLAENPDFVAAVQEKNTALIQKFAKSLSTEPQIDFVTITDTEGNVLARGHSDKAGDNVGPDRVSVQTPLKGTPITGLEPGSVVPLTLASGVPITSNGKIIGALVMGQDLSNGNFVNRMKQKTGVECTIFLNDTRISTTVMKDGKPAVGTKLNNEAIYSEVMNDNQAVVSRNTILEREYSTLYWPWEQLNGKNGGMFFVGMPRDDIEKVQNKIIILFLSAGAGLGLIMIIIGVLVAKAITAPLRQATTYAKEVAEGKFDGQLNIKSKDETATLATALKEMVNTIKNKIMEAEDQTRKAEEQSQAAHLATEQAEKSALEITEKQKAMLEIAIAIEEVSRNLSTDVKALSSEIENASRGAENQQARVSETSASMSEVNQATQDVAHKAAEASEISHEARGKAQDGAQMVSQVVESINNVEQKTTTLKQTMAELGEQAKGIDQVMTVIVEIADQTNLLALNAAIEAARAGEAGRGFAVVADEVRKLAEKTMEATREVGNTISGIQNGVQQSIGVVDETANMITQTTSLSMESGSALDRIVEMITVASDQIQAIAAAAEQQSASSESISSTFEEVSTISAQTAEAMERSSSALSNLIEQEKTLSSLVLRLKS